MKKIIKTKSQMIADLDNQKLLSHKIKRAKDSFLIVGEHEKGQIVIISGTDAKHIKKSLRMVCGDELNLFDNIGNEYTGRIQNIDGLRIDICIIEKHRILRENIIKVILCQSVPKLPKMDLIIQKTVEIGVTGIVPLITERSLIKDTNHSSLQNRLSRWNKISYESVKQCGRSIIPIIEKPTQFVNFLKLFESIPREDESFSFYQLENLDPRCHKFIFSTNYNDQSITSFFSKKRFSNSKLIPKDTKRVFSEAYLLIGPEGGFTNKEKRLSIDAGFIPLRLSPNILRVETAAILSVGLVMNHLEDFIETFYINGDFD